MTAIKKRKDGTIEIIEDAAVIEVQDGDSVFSESTQAAAVDVVPAWSQSNRYEAGDVIAYEGKLYRVAQAHMARPDRVPTVARDLFADVWGKE